MIDLATRSVRIGGSGKREYNANNVTNTKRGNKALEKAFNPNSTYQPCKEYHQNAVHNSSTTKRKRRRRHQIPQPNQTPKKHHHTRHILHVRTIRWHHNIRSLKRSNRHELRHENRISHTLHRSNTDSGSHKRNHSLF